MITCASLSYILITKCIVITETLQKLKWVLSSLNNVLSNGVLWLSCLTFCILIHWFSFYCIFFSRIIYFFLPLLPILPLPIDNIRDDVVIPSYWIIVMPRFYSPFLGKCHPWIYSFITSLSSSQQTTQKHHSSISYIVGRTSVIVQTCLNSEISFFVFSCSLVGANHKKKF